MKTLKINMGVAEFNPFHNGHQLYIDKLKESNPDIVAIIMSGNFCQRGEPSILDKYTRAEHAIKAGADIVFELPTVFAISPAEIFCKGAIKLLDSLKGDKTLYFGTETGTSEDFINISKLLNRESKEVTKEIKQNLSQGMPHALARVNAYKTVYPDVDFSILDTPNSVLGLEYVKALLKNNSTTKICPIKRTNDYNDLSLKGELASARAIRSAISDGKLKKVKKFVPDFVFENLPKTLPNFDQLLLFRVLEAKHSDLKSIVDCTEGLENRIKALVYGVNSYDEFISKLETRRYVKTRLSRIVLANLLSIDKELVEKSLKSNLYLKVLAVNKNKLNLLSAFCGLEHKLITRKSDIDNLAGTQKLCFYKDVYANDIYNLVTKNYNNEYQMRIVKT